LNAVLAVTIFGLVALVASGIDFVLGMRSIRGLHEIEPPDGRDLPSVSIVIAARNEERNIEEALRSLLALDYPAVEIVVVDDRSEDETGIIVRRVAAHAPATGPALRTCRVDELPTGWLGKNHALWFGAQHASGEWLLFSDADIVMAPSTLRRAVRYMVDGRIDHLALGPEVRMKGWLLRAFTLSGTLFFCLATRLWRARDPRSRAHIGIGAFNLVRRSAYDAVGGHRAIALRPDDDLKLGKLIKKHGRRQDFVHGRELVYVEWYATPGELVRGLTKNGFAALDYRLAAAVAGSIVPLFLFVWPVVSLVAGNASVRAAALATIVITLLMHVPVLRTQRVPLAYAPLYPVVAGLCVYVLVRSTFVTLVRGGIVWRGTYYPLEMLKTNRV
jgi:cellulose synthase/poly-beta-1,6-N-acetylglucosamine synthase-like glycosyltransferase